VIADASEWPGLPVAAWPRAQPGTAFTPPRGSRTRSFTEDTPFGVLAAHPAWADPARTPPRTQDLDGRRWHPRDPPGPSVGHTVPGMRGVYTHSPTRCAPNSKAPCRLGGIPARPRGHRTPLARPTAGRSARPVPGDPREVDLPNSSQHVARPRPAARLKLVSRASDLARCLSFTRGRNWVRTSDPSLIRVVTTTPPPAACSITPGHKQQDRAQRKREGAWLSRAGSHLRSHFMITNPGGSDTSNVGRARRRLLATATSACLGTAPDDT